MLDKVKKTLQNKTSKTDFFKVVGRYNPAGSNQTRFIERAYTTAKGVFKDDYRDTGERYFEHLRGVSLIVMVYLRVRDPNVIAAALLHDIIEDKPDWNEERLAVNFNSKVAEYVWWISKPDLSKFKGDKSARNRAYHQNLLRAPREPRLIKLADRLHNMITLWDYPEEKQRKKVEETQDFYLPIAEEEIVLVHELEAAINELRDSWK